MWINEKARMNRIFDFLRKDDGMICGWKVKEKRMEKVKGFENEKEKKKERERKRERKNDARNVTREKLSTLNNN